ncbi:hypothetical protein [Paenibacillus sp. BAC0078]
MKRKRVHTLGLMLLMLVLLTGCAKATAHVTVKKNGGLDIAFRLLLDSRAESLVGGKIEELITSRLQADGIELHKTNVGKSTEYQFLKSFASIEDMQLNARSLDVVDTEVATGKNWLYTKYDVVAQPKLNAYSEEILDGLGKLSVPKPLVRLMMPSLSLDFQLTLPYNLYGANNAAEQDGNTLTWHITLADTEPMRLTVYVPNVRNIAIAGGGIVLLLAAAVILFLRKRKLRKPKA